MFPFATEEELVAKTAIKQSVEVIAGDNFFTLLLTIASLVISAVTIFLFKDRKLQMRLCLLVMLVSIIILALYILNMRKLITSTTAL